MDDINNAVENFDDNSSWGFLVYLSLYYIWILIIIILWCVIGLLAFISSIICMFYNSSVGDKIAGLIIALFLGPFYFLFYIYNINYCNRTTYYYQ